MVVDVIQEGQTNDAGGGSPQICWQGFYRGEGWILVALPLSTTRSDPAVSFRTWQALQKKSHGWGNLKASKGVKLKGKTNPTE